MQTEKNVFSWLHLSDIHFGHGDERLRAHQSLVLAALKRDLEQNGPETPVNAIFVTGDIAFSGDALASNAPGAKTEYQDAETWLRSVATSVGLSSSAIFVVPGNHDVQRVTAKSDRELWRLIDRLRAGDEDLDSALAHEADRQRLEARIQAFLQFASRLRGEETIAQALWWAHAVPNEEIRIRLIGINTSLLCNDDTDRGKLRIGNIQIREAFENSGDDICIVLSHHPLSGNWLSDETEALGWIRRLADIHLSGHIHEADSENALSGATGAFCRVSAGAVHPDPTPGALPSAHGYNRASILVQEGGDRVLRIWPRRWSVKKASFVVDVDNLPEGQTFIDHPLPPRRSGTPNAVRRPRPSSGIPDPLPATHSLASLADQIELELKLPVELIVHIERRIIVWLREPSWNFQRVKSLVLAAGCLLSGASDCDYIEIGLCDSTTMPHSTGEGRVGFHRFHIGAKALFEIARTKTVPDGFWDSVIVKLDAKENVFWAPVLTLSVSDLERTS